MSHGHVPVPARALRDQDPAARPVLRGTKSGPERKPAPSSSWSVTSPATPGTRTATARRLRIECVASKEWPGLFHGVLETELPLLHQDGYRDIGTFRFHRGVGEISRAFLLCGYATTNQRYPEAAQ